jgi:nucleoside-diphosphate-sugar epimerase
LYNQNKEVIDMLLPENITSVAQLDDFMSQPSERLQDFFRHLDGDIMIIGASGKTGPTLARMAIRAVKSCGSSQKVYVVARSAMDDLVAAGCQAIRCDLSDWEAVSRLPRVKNVIFLVGFKFGAEAAKSQTWAMNTIVPYHVARHFQGSRIVSLSTGCVYPVMHLSSGGATEQTPPEPVGEYAQSCLGRERMFDFFADRKLESVVHIRLNYAVECRYGVLRDIGEKVLQGEPLDLTTGYANVIWQGDAAEQILLSLSLAAAPAMILNLTGPECFSIRQVAEEFGRLLGKTPVFSGEPNGYGYLNNASKANELFGYPRVPLNTIIKWTAEWLRNDGPSLGKPTHFQTQDGKY